MIAHWKAEWWAPRPRWKALPWRAGMWLTPRRRKLVGRPAGLRWPAQPAAWARPRGENGKFLAARRQP